MQIQLLGNRVAVEKLKKSQNKTDGFLVQVNSEEHCGIVKLIGHVQSSPVSLLNAKVYFGNKFQLVRMDGTELCVMDTDNILAVELE